MNTNDLKTAVAAIPLVEVDGRQHLPLDLATDAVARLLYPHLPLTQLTDGAIYTEIAQTTRDVCREMGYGEIVHLHPPTVSFKEDGAYLQENLPSPNDGNPDIIIGVTFDEEIHDGRLHNPRMAQWDLAEVSRQHFKIPVMADEHLLDLIEQACSGDWPNDPKGIWHDILTVCRMLGQDDSATGIRRFSVIIQGIGKQKNWPMEAVIIGSDEHNAILTIRLAETRLSSLRQPLFSPGRVLATAGLADSGIDVMPYLRRHLAGEWGDLEEGDLRRNDYALKHGERLFSAYLLPPDEDGYQAKIWIISEWDRSATTIMYPDEY